jgi:mRNA interferase MazF
MLPDAGDIAWVEFDPVLGTEQAGRRPGLILTARIYHEQSPRAVVCPITSISREWPFNVPLPSGLKARGIVLIDQIRVVDRAHRIFDFIDRAPREVMDEVRVKLAALLGIDFAASGPGLVGPPWAST